MVEILHKFCRRVDKTNLSMVWPDYKKAYHIIPHAWILKYFSIKGTARNIIAVISNMNYWKIVLTLDESELWASWHHERDLPKTLLVVIIVVIMLPLTLALRKMKAGYRHPKDMTLVNIFLFLDDWLLYGANWNQLDSLVQTVRIFSEDIQMSLDLMHKDS